MRCTLYAAAIALCLVVGTQAWADTISWTDWTAATTGSGGSATGTMTVGGSAVTVTYSGPLSFANLSGSVYWTEFSPAPYTGNAVIDNGPLGEDLLALDVAGTHTLTFSQALVNPVMTIVSQGRPGYAVTYDFDTSFTVLSEGRGYWGDGTYTLGGGDVLTGYDFSTARFSSAAH